MTIRLSKRLTLRAPAKVNLCLSVRYPPAQGYHLLDSVFQTLDVHDVIDLRICPAQEETPVTLTRMGTPVALDCGSIDIPTSDNLIFKAIDGVEQACAVPMAPPGHMLRIAVDKRIPAGGGLGGGSSDAAAVLRAYAALQNVNPLGGDVLEVARRLGADVAFFLYGGAALMTGRGDELQRCLPPFPLPLVLMGDAQGNSTAAVYADFDGAPAQACDSFALAEAMEAPDVAPEALASLCGNNLEPAACRIGTALAQRIERAKADSAVLNALVTGSGATSFAICATEADAREFANRAREYCDWVCVAHACES